MNLALSVDGHYYRTPDGKVFSQGVYGYSFFRRYLDVFHKVYVLARVEKVDECPTKCKESSGDCIEFVDIPLIRRPTDAVNYKGKIEKELSNSWNLFECAIVRSPSSTSYAIYQYLKSHKIPTVLEVVVDPWEYFAPHTIDKFYRPIIRYNFTHHLKKMCREAIGVSYVTEHYLQGKYPCKALGNDRNIFFTGNYSSVEIADGSIAEPRVYHKKNETFHFIHAAATFSSEGKGQPVVIKALKQLLEMGYNADVTFIGDGPLRTRFENIASKLGINEKVIFAGRLPGVEAVRTAMRNADVFVFPTRAEGLPRVLIEAMAEGLPCISSHVCGIPEILSPKWMVSYDDIPGLAKTMAHCIDSPNELTEQSQKNVMVASRFTNSILSKNRCKFYSKLRQYTENKDDNNELSYRVK